MSELNCAFCDTPANQCGVILRPSESWTWGICNDCLAELANAVKVIMDKLTFLSSAKGDQGEKGTSPLSSPDEDDIPF
jgi:hypothetical protein